MPEGEKEADGKGLRLLPDQLARDIVDGCDVVGIDGVAQAEAIGEKTCPEQHGVVMEGGQRPEPGRRVEGGKRGSDAQDAAAQALCRTTDETAWPPTHSRHFADRLPFANHCPAGGRRRRARECGMARRRIWRGRDAFYRIGGGLRHHETLFWRWQ